MDKWTFVNDGIQFTICGEKAAKTGAFGPTRRIPSRASSKGGLITDFTISHWILESLINF